MWRIGDRKNFADCFSLLEAVLYIALVSVLFLGLVYFLVSVTNSRAKSIALTEVEDNGRIALQHFRRLITSANIIYWNRSVLDNHPGLLVFEDGDGNEVEISLNQMGSLIVKGQGVDLALTGNMTRISKLVFRKYDDYTIGLDLAISYWPQANNQSYEYESKWQTSFRMAK